MAEVNLAQEKIEITTPNTLDIQASGVVVGKLIKREKESALGHAYDVVLQQRLDISAVHDSLRKYLMRTTGRAMTTFLFDHQTGMFEVYLEEQKATPRS